MNVTEVLINGFDGDKAVFSARLTPGTDLKLLTVTEYGDSSMVETVSDVATSAFTSVQRVIEDLVTVGSQRG